MRFNYSAKQPKRLKEAFHFGTQAATVIMIATYQQAIEKIKSSMLIHILRQGILLVPLMWLFNRMFGTNEIWISFPVTEILVFFIAVILQTFIQRNTKL